jgi:hypothetical protein
MAQRKLAKSKPTRTKRMAEKSGKSRGRRPIGKSARSDENRADLPEKPRAQADRHEAPVDAEIKRAAERAGVKAPAEPESDFVPPPPPGHEAFAARHRELDEKRLCDLSALLTADLWTADEQPGLQAETAMCHVAAAQLKAITLSLTSSDDQGPDGWGLTQDEMTNADVIAALSGVTSLLRYGPKLVEWLRSRGELRSSVSRAQAERAEVVS